MLHPRLHVRRETPWPPLPLAEWRETADTLHMWTQIVGKVKLALSPMLNHWWQVPLYVSARGLTTGMIPSGAGALQMDFDFFDHNLVISDTSGRQRRISLPGRSVAGFYREMMNAMAALGVDAPLHPVPVEVANPIPFPEDRRNAYDTAAVLRFWRVLVQAERVLNEFRGRFLGKVSPVHFFWGSFDLAVSRFSGRAAPSHPGAPNVPDYVTREAYSHEVSSAGFWPGGGAVDEAAFYSYAYPEPPGFRDYPVRPEAAYYNEQLREFILPYEAVRTAREPDTLLMDFLQTSYEAAAERGGWDRAALERP